MTLGSGVVVALYIVLFFVLVFAIITVALLGIAAYALIKLRRQVEVAVDKMNPLISKATSTLVSVERYTSIIGDKTESILDRTEKVTEDLAEKVEHTASFVQRTVTSPLINLSSLMAGVAKGVNSWKGATGENANNHRRDKTDGE